MLRRRTSLKLPSLAGAAVFLIAYAIAYRLGEHAYGALGVPSPFWLPDSVLLCALLVTPKEHWWFFVAAIWPIRLLSGGVPGTPLWFIVASTANDAVKAVGVAWLLRRVASRPARLDTFRDLLAFLGIAALAAPTLSALAAAPLRVLLGSSFWTAAYQWFLGDVLAQVIVTPTLLYWWTRAWRHTHARLGELLLVGTGLAAAMFYAFVSGGNAHAPILVYVPVPFLVYAAVRLRPFGTANAIALVSIVSMISAVRGVGVFGGQPGEQPVLSLQLFLLAIAVPLLSLSILIAEREALRGRELHFNARLIEAQERERARIARQLDADLGQRLALLQVSLGRIGENMNPAAEPRHELLELSRMAARMSSDIHNLSNQLHPSTLEIVGLEIALRGLCREFTNQYELHVRFSSQGTLDDLPRDVSLCLFRVAQEALHNVARHSAAREAVVALSHHGGWIRMSVSDEGTGFDPGAVEAGGMGLISMRERLRSIGGRLSIRSVPEAGTTIRVDVPMHARTERPRPLEAAG